MIEYVLFMSTKCEDICYSMPSLALSGMNNFVTELLVFIKIIVGSKYLIMPKVLNYFCNGNWNNSSFPFCFALQILSSLSSNLGYD